MGAEPIETLPRKPDRLFFLGMTGISATSTHLAEARAWLTGRARPLRVLFVHQNFPGQFVHLARALVESGAKVASLGISAKALAGVSTFRYTVDKTLLGTRVDLARDAEKKIARGSACAKAMLVLKDRGLAPDIVIAHSGWGEALFCRSIWPNAKHLLFSEFFYRAKGADFDFDPEHLDNSASAGLSLEIKNLALLHALQSCDAAYTPTKWQWAQLPMEYRSKVQVIFDGIDTLAVRPDRHATVTIPGIPEVLRSGDELITFVSRNLEPYRGFHIFMRALPRILKERPNARCVIVGGDGVSYGRMPKGASCWREALLREVGQHLPLERVHFTGQLNYFTYLKLLQVSRCHVYLTYPFVLSWSLIEAMSAGCTIVASETPPVQEVIEHEKSGLLVNFFDVANLAATVVKVLASGPSYRDLGEHARRKVQDEYDLHTRCLPQQLQLLRASVEP